MVCTRSQPARFSRRFCTDRQVTRHLARRGIPPPFTSIVWTVANHNTGKHERIRSLNNERADAVGAAWFGFGRGDVHVRRDHFGEDVGWAFNPISQLGNFTPPEVWA